MPELKPIRREAIAAALRKAAHYRLLNEPREAESICRDVLAVDADNQEARASLVLSLTDLFASRAAADMSQALQEATRVHDEYERTYLTGLIYERWGKAQLSRGAPPHAALGWVREALGWFAKAEALSPEDNDEAVLRWNACVRLLQGMPSDPANPPGEAAGPRDMPFD